MKMLLNVVFMAFFCVSFIGCDKLKGDKGDTGATGQNAVSYSKTYTGRPTSNIYSVTLDIAYNQNTDILNVYKVDSGGTMLKLPLTFGTWTDYYMTSDNGLVVSLATIDYANPPNPSIALQDSSGTRYNYSITHMRFKTVSAAIAFKTQNRINNSTYNTILYGNGR